MPYHISSNGSAGGRSSAYAVFSGIKPLTRTIFAPNIFLIFSKSNFFHISPIRLKPSIMGNYLDFALKIAHWGNTGSHKGNIWIGVGVMNKRTRAINEETYKLIVATMKNGFSYGGVHYKPKRTSFKTNFCCKRSAF